MDCFAYIALPHYQVRLFIRRGLSVRYLLPNAVVDYIEQHGLYQDEGPSSSSTDKDKGKDKERESNSERGISA